MVRAAICGLESSASAEAAYRRRAALKRTAENWLGEAAMKQVRADDFWRRLGRRAPQSRIANLQGASIQNFPSSPIPIPGAITVITGLNGVGKSTLIHAAHLILQRGSAPNPRNAALRASTGKLTCAFTGPDAETKASVILAEESWTQDPP